MLVHERVEHKPTLHCVSRQKKHIGIYKQSCRLRVNNIPDNRFKTDKRVRLLSHTLRDSNFCTGP